jgi:hypothetical protein
MTEMQETLQSSVDSLKRLLLVAVVMLIFLVLATYTW